VTSKNLTGILTRSLAPLLLAAATMVPASCDNCGDQWSLFPPRVDMTLHANPSNADIDAIDALLQAAQDKEPSVRSNAIEAIARPSGKRKAG